MKQTDLKKLAAALLILFVLANLLVFALKLISAILFWTVIIVVGIITYLGFKKPK